MLGMGGSRFETGYGKVRWDGREVLAHRRSYEMAHGAIAPGLFVCHRCDNKPCVRPDHLFLGTPNDNVQDLVAKGLNLRGERIAGSRLTEADVLAIRRGVAAGERSCNLARRHGVDPATIADIKAGRTWAWLRHAAL